MPYYPLRLFLGSLALPSTVVGKPEFIIDFLDRHCLECHEADLGEGYLTLHDLPNDFTIASTVDIWQNVL